MVLKNIAPPLTAWKSYEYFPGGHIYRDIDHDPAGGPGGAPCIWADDALWTIDTPEQPNSILFLLHYRFWENQPPLDLRHAELRFRLRGEGLALHGARCHFWAVTYAPSATRWHYTAETIPVSDGGWGEEVTLRLAVDPSRWHRSFAVDPDNPQDLESTLACCFSFGFSFVGFSQKVTGRIGLADFRLLQEVDPAWPYVFNGKDGVHDWLTLSAAARGQVRIAAPERVAAGICALIGDGGPGLYLHGDYLPLGEPFTFVYLAVARARETTGGRDLRHAMVMVRQAAAGFDAKGGKICFFVEHAASGTRWVLKVPIENRDNRPWCAVLPTDPAFWGRLSGAMPLEEVLAGGNGAAGYDFFGLMLTGTQGMPAGIWGMTQFSLGPTVDRRHAPVPGEMAL
jgi:hypothetical protein